MTGNERSPSELLAEEQATSAELRRRLQRAHGALYAFRALASAPKPFKDWEWADAASAFAELQATCSLPELLESTRPDTASGLPLLARLRELTADGVRLRTIVSKLFDTRMHGRLRRNPELWTGERPGALREAAKVVFQVLADGIAQGGVSSGQVVERLREKGIPVTVSCLHGSGLQAVANATCGGDDELPDPEKLSEDEE